MKMMNLMVVNNESRIQIVGICLFAFHYYCIYLFCMAMYYLILKKLLSNNFYVIFNKIKIKINFIKKYYWRGSGLLLGDFGGGRL